LGATFLPGLDLAGRWVRSPHQGHSAGWTFFFRRRQPFRNQWLQSYYSRAFIIKLRLETLHRTLGPLTPDKVAPITIPFQNADHLVAACSTIKSLFNLYITGQSTSDFPRRNYPASQTLITMRMSCIIPAVTSVSRLCFTGPMIAVHSPFLSRPFQFTLHPSRHTHLSRHVHLQHQDRRCARRR